MAALKDGVIRVLVVDDSAFMRVALKKMIDTDEGIQVIDTARNGEEALQKIEQLKPDLVTMDIEMPVMDGLAALEKVMQTSPLPVIMISSLTEEGAEATMKALDLGAVDFIPKGGKSYVNLDIVKISEQLRQKIRAIVTRNRLQRLAGKTVARPFRPSSDRPKPRAEHIRPAGKRCQIVTLGISTGGPLALNFMMPRIPGSFSSSILIVQHMPPMFTGPFARRLNDLSQIRVKEAEQGEILRGGQAYVAPGGIHMKLAAERNGQYRIVLDPQPDDRLFIPSVDIMMLSVAEYHAGRILGVIMTGMGNDGLQGMAKIREKGGVTLAQEESTCVVYGMPKVCVEKGIVDHVVGLDRMAETIFAHSG